MKQEFAKALYTEMKKHGDIILVTADLGFKLFDEIRDNLPNQFINVGCSEQAGLDICVGLALSGKLPIFYSITPFALWRPAETIRIYLDHERIPVKIVGSGRDDDYHNEGFTHNAHDARCFMDLFPNIEKYWPVEDSYIQKVTQYMLYNDKPSFLSLRK